MTEIVDRAVAALRRMPSAERDGVARAILTLAQDGPPLDIEPEHLPSVLEGLAQIERGEYVSDADVERAFRSFDP